MMPYRALNTLSGQWCDMHKIEDYRVHAAECREMAGRARNDADREMLLNMARTWDSLADARIEQLTRAKRLEALEGENRNRS
jgi:hypothetical protein